MSDPKRKAPSGGASTPAAKRAANGKKGEAPASPSSAAAAATVTALVASAPPPASSPFVNAMLTDLYQISMAYSYWCAGKSEEPATFDLFFRRCPFRGEYAIFAGLDEVLQLLSTYRFTSEQIGQLRSRFPTWRPGFWDYLGGVTARDVKVCAVPQGTIVFPRVPLIRVQGPLGVAQLLETTLLALTNFASLVCTNAARHRVAAGPDKQLLEFGLRRAQGPDGAMSASRYCIVGGFNATSNVQAAVHYGIEVKGTHAHAYVVSFTGLGDLRSQALGECPDFVSRVLKYRDELCESTNDGELAAFISYAQAFPDGFLALIDTYDTMHSGLFNFLAVALALKDVGYAPRGVRLDSGDLAYFSREVRKEFRAAAERYGHEEFARLTIVASNDLSEKVIYALKEQQHEIDAFGIGTHLVTCKDQPALGCVYKLVEISGKPRIKVSADAAKVTIPGKKSAYRLFDSKGFPVLDLLTFATEPAPAPGERVLCRHPFDANKRVHVVPSRVEPLLQEVWNGAVVDGKMPTMNESRAKVSEQMKHMREDHLRLLNPTPYKVALTQKLFDFLHKLWQEETPVREIS